MGGEVVFYVIDSKRRIYAACMTPARAEHALAKIRDQIRLRQMPRGSCNDPAQLRVVEWEEPRSLWT